MPDLTKVKEAHRLLGEFIKENETEPIISGRINHEYGEPLDDIILRFEPYRPPVDPIGYAATKNGGYYDYSVPRGWTGRITPISDGYVFKPLYKDYLTITKDVPFQDFTGKKAPAIG